MDNEPCSQDSLTSLPIPLIDEDAITESDSDEEAPEEKDGEDDEPLMFGDDWNELLARETEEDVALDME